MLKALQQTVWVGAGGKIELVAPECPEGADVQVIVLLTSPLESVSAQPIQALERDGMNGERQSAIALPLAPKSWQGNPVSQMHHSIIVEMTD